VDCFAGKGKFEDGNDGSPRIAQVETYNEWIEPYLVSNTLEILDREIPRLKSKIQSVQLCFTTDPFMYGYSEICQMSLASIKKLNQSDIKCTILTKGLLPRELSGCSSDNEYGITLISLDDAYRERVEPGAASYKDRLAALKYLCDKGCKTWVSIEPYPTPNLIKQDLQEILETVEFTDKIIFGRTNYSKEISAYREHKAFYNEQAELTIAFCEERGIDYHIKEGTMAGSAALVVR
jgi:DNA repair photolyase